MSTNGITARSMAVRHRPPPQRGAGKPTATLTVERHDWHGRAEITLTGEVDLDSAPLLRRALTQCLAGGVRTIEVDLARVTFCDCSGLSALLQARHRAAILGASLRLHHPRPTMAKLIALAGTDTGLLPRNGVGESRPSLRSLPARDTAVDCTLTVGERRLRW
ncbi:STAS domain-containing protein [Streptacidiphilus sp. MAP5-3]|uniref:STAS domain-containing protein n=1 Tax=unclassified Streptacidiphilus TaxID=2643834 RepID=UPI003512DB80